MPTKVMARLRDPLSKGAKALGSLEAPGRTKARPKVVRSSRKEMKMGRKVTINTMEGA